MNPFISLPCPEFLERPIRIRIQDRNLEYAEDSEGYQLPRIASIEEEALYQAVNYPSPATFRAATGVSAHAPASPKEGDGLREVDTVPSGAWVQDKDDLRVIRNDRGLLIGEMKTAMTACLAVKCVNESKTGLSPSPSQAQAAAEEEAA